MEAKFCKPLTIAQLAVLRSGLIQRKDETVSMFFTRCKVFHLEEDSGLTQAQRAEAVFITEFTRRHKLSFMTGLRQEIKLHMRGINPNRSTLEEILEEAETAEIMTTPTTPHGAVATLEHGKTSAEEAQAMAALTANLSEDGKKTVEAMQQLMAFRFGNRGRTGRGGGRGGQQAGRGRGGPSLDVLQSREKALCQRCGKMAKHRTKECFVNLDK